MTLDPKTFPGLEATEIALMQRVLQQLPANSIGLEIGCFEGFSSSVILDAAPGMMLVSIDPMTGDTIERTMKPNETRLLSNMRPYGTRWSFMRDTSINASRGFSIANADLDFIFIDGDHTEYGCRQDFETWTPRLKSGGLLAMHDCRIGRPGGATFHPGPSKVAEGNVFSRPDAWEVVGEAYSLMIARKR